MQYLLTEKLFCGNCGGKMLGKSHEETNCFYKCDNTKSVCNKQDENKDFIERLVVEETIRKVMSRDVMDTLTESVAKLSEKEFNDTSRLDALKDELKDVQTKIGDLLQLVEQGVDVDGVGNKLQELGFRKNDILKQIEEEKRVRPFLTKEGVGLMLSKIVIDGDINDNTYRQRVIDTFVNKVCIFDNDDGSKKVSITYNTSANIESTITLFDEEP